ncbi:monovalent cation/H+ antiporter complex subunit F [Marinactinospora thermotolerans]|uniref:Multisubunit sodium/proton antiporter, MrpF subunit n=1 Tax=Marinactinospora thermotolerans DSM 45154 TaxID=1122192 RepID=A0A1T4SMI4_9ACTN|nr:monovalent cation/H+ antiporter complex subunit F [Marinactinospora thermotolerans]SKA29363.1 multisubunit sodium/proton antiporter, MrpF subunit [Marinactinospora thermotolerans DSM 45154]
MNVLEHVYTATFAMLGAGVLFTLVRLVRGPSVLDRIICLNALSVLVVSSIAVEVAVRGDTAYIGLMVTIALLGFVGTLTAARFAERRAHDRG